MLDDGVTDSDQVEGGLGEDDLVSGETGGEFLLVLQSQVFAYCWRFGPARTVNRPVNLSLRVPAQMG
jgi:hypothetical protein